MQQEGKTFAIYNNQTYQELASLLVLFLHSPSPDLQHRLTLFQPELYLQLILNPSQTKEVRQACCASFKAQINNNKLFHPYAQGVISQIEASYFSIDEKILSDIEGSFEMLIEKLFEMYLDDEKKLDAFASIMQKISSNSDIRNSANNLRGLKLALLLVRAMEPSTLNNEISIGELICFFKQVYYSKNRTSDESNINGRGLELIQLTMSMRECEPHLSAFLKVQIEITKLIKEILQKLEAEEIQEGTSIPASYISNSDEIDNLFQAILCINIDGRIYCENKQVNEFKALLISIYLEQFPYHVGQSFLLLCFSTISKSNVCYIVDDIDTIVAAVLQLLERSTNHGSYAAYYYSNTQIMVLKLFELITVGESEREAIQSDPSHFAEISDDFCKNQESQSVKVRAGSLLYNLCLTIDGSLTFVTNMAMIPLYALEKQLTEKIHPETQPREICVNSAKGLQVMLDLWSGSTPENFTEVSLLILSCISDLIIKRNEFNRGVRDHLNIMQTFFSFKEQILSSLPPIIISRYIQLFSFYSFPGCLDHFLPYYEVHQVYSESILKALETIMQFHDKKSEEMRNYVSLLSKKILLLSSKLTPLLEQTIHSRPEMILCIKEKLVEKLVLWLLDYFQKENIFGCNKISNLLCKVIEQYPKFMIETDEFGFNFDLEALNQYLIPLYKKILNSQLHPAQETIIDVAVQHIECIGLNITTDILQNFVQMGVVVVQHNECVLNKCLQLFSRTLSLPNMEKNKEKMEFIKLRKIQVEIAQYLLPKISLWINKINDRDCDRWQILYLLEMILYTLKDEQPILQGLDLSKLKEFYTTSSCEIIKIKIMAIWMLLVQILQDEQCQAARCLQTLPIPERIPPYEKNNFTIYMMSIVKYFSNPQYQVYLIRCILKMFYPAEKYKKYLMEYENLLHCSANPSQAEIYAFQTVQTVLHPLNSAGTDTYKQFRLMYQAIQNWQTLRIYMNQHEPGLIRDIMSYQMVGAKPRRIYHIKK